MDALRELRNSKQSFMRVNRQRDSSAQRKSRTVLSCIPCRERKVKCDRLEPCNQCTRRSVVERCDYSPKTARVGVSTSPTTITAALTRRDADNSPIPPSAPAESLATSAGVQPTSACDHNVSASRMGMVDSLTQSCFHGSGSRTRYFGRSHWALTMDMAS
ncbi:hypothetical protein N7520_010926 [Penicillium odoratum]|uniref:uncharacterized protein n=1 Tax=Penicillium odoratum TaxID=1167516 RepID=UPI0025474BBD|nr:uncharacterized protein N7520_010926 [Penicillium odoratum]KAJ5745744.1 hypothetical protein N7520_010926 [Penicillium odoratum]